MATFAMLVALVAQVLLVTPVPVAMARREPLRLLCSTLPTDDCAFAVDSFGQRCVLETMSGGMNWHICQTSDVLVGDGSPVEYIETEKCVKECGVTKMTVGLSTDSLESDAFTSMLCSQDCQAHCPNIVDLYTNLAAGEGKSLKLMCASHRHQDWEHMPVLRRKQIEVNANLDTAELTAEEPAPAQTSGA